MVMKWTAVCLVALALFGSFCDAQWPGYQKPGTQQEIKNPPQQSKQTHEKPFNWVYPQPPVIDPMPAVDFELRHPVAAATVAVECREAIAHVEVKRDLFGIGQFINPADLTLGTCPVTAEDMAAQVLIFDAQLHDCGSLLMMTEDALIYTFTLNYNPQPLGIAPVVRTSKAAVIVECHYPRKHNVSSLPLDPVWIPFSAVKVAEEFLYFSLVLMTDDWMYQRPSYQYFLGDIINIEASVMQYLHVPLRVYVDSCVATLSTDMNSSPRYAFIENHGCLLDARITGSSSKFMARTAENKLQFQLEAFRFQGSESGLLYITCHLKATSTAYVIDSQHRACSYISGWREVSGADAACGSCETSGLGDAGKWGSGGGGGGGSSGKAGTSTGSWGTGIGSTSPSNPGRKIRDVSQSEYVAWEGDVTLGPIPIAEKLA